MSNSIPAALQALPNWALYIARPNPKPNKPHKTDKIPLSPDTGGGVSTHDVWWSFNECMRSPHRARASGLGFNMTGVPGLVGIDLDECVDDLLGVAPWAAEIAERSAGYAEVSPSGRGLRIFVRGSVDADWTDHTRGIEVYAGHAPRFLTVTGDRLPESADDVLPAPPGFLDWLAATYQPARVVVTSEVPAEVPEPTMDLLLPPIDDATERVRAFLHDGTLMTGDRSTDLYTATRELYRVLGGPTRDADVLGHLVASPHVMAIALDHRRQDEGRAVEYLWDWHCVKARAVVPQAQHELVAAAFAGLAVVDGEAGEPEPMPTLDRDGKGNLLATTFNAVTILDRPDVIGFDLRYDAFTDGEMIALKPDQWQAITDAIATDIIKCRLEQGMGMKPIQRAELSHCIHAVAKRHEFDSAKAWMAALPAWDGMPRVDGFLVDYCGADDTEYARAVSRYLWTALAGRALVPGIKCDMAPVLVGPQGARKSATVAAIAPSPEAFTEIKLGDRGADLSRQMRGVLVGELSELQGMATRDAEWIKGFMTSQYEKWTPKYREREIRFARRLVFVGTSNKDDFLSDETGERRWLPVHVGQCDPAAVERDREQLWAEAAVLFDADGIAWSDAERLGRGEHEQFKYHDSWEPLIAKWLDEPDSFDEVDSPKRGTKPFTTAALLIGALGLHASSITKAHEKRAAAVLKTNGYTNQQFRLNGAKGRYWCPLSHAVPLGSQPLHKERM